MKRYKTFIAALLTAVAVWGQDGLPFYLKTAAENNPAVKAAFLAYEAALQKAPQAGAYEPPQLEMGVFLEPMDLLGGRQLAQFQLMQMFPWFGTKKAARTEAQHMAKMAFEQFREAKDNLYLEVYTQWYRLCESRQKLINSEENIRILQQLETLALQRTASGNGAPGMTGDRQSSSPADAAAGNPSSAAGGMGGMNMSNPPSPAAGSRASVAGEGGGMSGTAAGVPEVLRIRIERLESEDNRENLLSEIAAKKARFNALLNLPAEHEIALPDTVLPLPLPPGETELIQLIAQQNPMLEMFNQEALAYKAKAEMDRKMSYPMFGIGLQYMLIGKSAPAANASMNGMMMDGGNAMNGKDMLMPMLSVTVPVYRNRYKALQRENELLQQASRAKYADTFNNLQAEVYQLKHQLQEAKRKTVLYEKQAELAQAAYRLAVQEFVSGKNNLGDVIRIQRQLLDYRLKNAEAVAGYNTFVANLYRLAAKWE
jgi:outer membrane protein TolC